MTNSTHIQLFHFERCPYCEKARRAFQALHLDYESHLIDPSDRSEVKKVSGQEKVPVIHDGETLVVGSTQIVKYLDTYYGSSQHLIPKNPQDMAQTVIFDKFADEVWGPLTYKSLTRKGDDGAILNRNELDNLRDEIETEATLIDDYFQGHEYIVGVTPSLGDLALTAFISRIEEHSPFDIGDNHKYLWNWYHRVGDRLN